MNDRAIFQKWSAFAQLRKQTHNSVIEQIAKGQKMTKTKRYDLPSYTEGWFQIGWSQQLPLGNQEGGAVW